MSLGLSINNVQNEEEDLAVFANSTERFGDMQTRGRGAQHSKTLADFSVLLKCLYSTHIPLLYQGLQYSKPKGTIIQQASFSITNTTKLTTLPRLPLASLWRITPSTDCKMQGHQEKQIAAPTERWVIPFVLVN